LISSQHSSNDQIILPSCFNSGSKNS